MANKLKVLVFVFVFVALGATACSGAPATQDPLIGAMATNMANQAVDAAAQATVQAEEAAVLKEQLSAVQTQMAQPTLTPQPTATPLPTATPQPSPTPIPTETPTLAPALDLGEIFTGSVPNFCDVTNTTQEDIDGEMIQHNGSIYENSAIGADKCAAAFEGRWYEGFPPTEDHHVTAFIGAAENTSVYQGSQWLLPVGATPRQIMYDLALGKCDNWDASQVDPEPVVFDYVDMSTKAIVHTEPTTCDLLRAKGNPLPEEIGLIPGEMLPHFSVGYTWGKAPVEGAPASGGQPVLFSGESKFDSENKGMVCRSDTNPLMGNNAVTLDPSWDLECIYLLDGVLDGKRSIGLVKGKDLATVASAFDASVWAVPAEWVALKWADQFAMDNCPAALPVMIFDGNAWQEHHVFACP